MAAKLVIPEIADTLRAEWPGEEGLIELAIDLVREDANVLCVIFGRGGTIGAEAVGKLVLGDDGVWEVRG